ncbi:MAG: glycosyltransferase family 2 protein [candidate division WOR-3 bacterium]|nr:MAG: glycosyltransferase family 2 protein [candidate division WOR-3 bacterium]
MRLTVLIPVYNEEQSVSELISHVRAVPVEKEILVVDDHSSDNTLRVIRSIPDIRVFAHETNRGKGAAIRTGLAHATGDVVVIQDADLEYDPADYPRLLAPFADPRVDAVYGSRFRGNGNFLFLSRMANYFLTFVTNAFFGGRITDMETCYKAIRRQLFQDLDLTANRFEIEPEITTKLLRRGARIVEVPIAYRARTEGKKIGPRDGLMACWSLAKWYVR